MDLVPMQIKHFRSDRKDSITNIKSERQWLYISSLSRLNNNQKTKALGLFLNCKINSLAMLCVICFILFQRKFKGFLYCLYETIMLFRSIFLVNANILPDKEDLDISLFWETRLKNEAFFRNSTVVLCWTKVSHSSFLLTNLQCN